MAKQSLEHSASSLNSSLDSYDLLSNSLGKAHALAHVALSEHFALSHESIIHDYMALLGDLIEQAREAFDTLGTINSLQGGKKEAN